MMTTRDEKKTRASSLQNYVESKAIFGLDCLPAEARRNLKRIRELSGREQSMLEEIDRIGSEFLQMVGKANQAQRKERYRQIEDLFKKLKECADERVQLANQTFKLVDQRLKQLDSDLAKYRIRERASMTVQAGPAPPARIKRPRMEENELEESTSAWSGMPVDTNEPTYCVCRLASYGDMVACDNKECEIEWFHYDCMGLSSPPAGDWYCPKCRPGSSGRGN